jgi:dephospho-CoA kinase
VIGLTGGIASGKSSISRMLAERGAHVIDADRIGHEVIAPDGEAYPKVIIAFGTGVLAEDGTIDRKKVAAIVFSDPEALRRLNDISHPCMAERMAREIRQVRARPPSERPPLILLDAAILFEAGWDGLCDRIWTVETTPELAAERLMARDAMTRAEVQARLAAQMSNPERARRAHAVIRNEGSLEALQSQVERLWEEASAGVPA